MIQVAERIQTVEEYYFSKKRVEIAKMQEEGADIIHLGIGCPDMTPDEFVHKTICDQLYKPASNAYQLSKGSQSLRDAFASWYKRIYKVDVDANSNVLPLTGSKEGILLVNMAYVNPGDTVLIPDPGYPAYTSCAKMVGANIKYYNLKNENNWLPDFDELESLVDNKTKVLWCTYPGMPTGKQAEDGLFEKLKAFAKKHNILVVNDNPYSLILTDRPRSILQQEDALENCIELNSLSKASNLPGMRMGVAFAHKDVISALLKVKSNYDNGMYKPVVEGAVAALNLGEDWYKKINEESKKRRELVFEFMTKLGTTYNPNSTGLFVFSPKPERFKNGLECADYLLYEKHIFITPGFIFGKNGENFIRVSLCSSEDKIRQAISRL